MGQKIFWATWVNGRDWEFEGRKAAKYWAETNNGSTPRKITRNVPDTKLPPPYWVRSGRHG